MSFLLEPNKANEFMSNLVNMYGLVMKVKTTCTHGADEDCPLADKAANVAAIIEGQLMRCSNESEFEAMSYKCAEIYSDFVVEFNPCPEVKSFFAAKLLSLTQRIVDNYRRVN